MFITGLILFAACDDRFEPTWESVIDLLRNGIPVFRGDAVAPHLQLCEKMRARHTHGVAEVERIGLRFAHMIEVAPDLFVAVRDEVIKSLRRVS